MKKTEQLYDKATSRSFYEQRYATHYMEEWPEEKRERVLELVRSLPLPETGTALDYGCGNGIFTDVLKRALPRWDVYGCDISAVSVKNAGERFPQCRFFVSDDAAGAVRTFDFLFSHHVLEHVYDIKRSIEEMAAYTAPRAAMLHILPCGNTDSFEHRVASMRVDGINEKLGNRLFHEDEGHLRRLSRAELVGLLDPFGFELRDECYAHHEFGFVEWITRSTLRTVMDFADPAKARSAADAAELRRLRRRLVLQFMLRFPTSIYRKAQDPTKPPIRHVIRAFGWIPYRLGLRYFNRLVRQTEDEWVTRKRDPRAGEMYLYFVRDAT